MKIRIGERSVWVNFNHLYYFSLVATEGSVAGVAKRLGLGQPALSIQLKQFEQNLGLKLFERSHKKLTLTEHGVMALDYAREIFRLGGEMVEALYDQPTINRIHLQIGAIDSIPKHLTLALAEKAIATGRCHVSIHEGKSDELLRELVQHRLDLVLTNRGAQAFPGVAYRRKLATLPVWIVGDKSFVRLRKNFPESLQGEPMVVPTVESQIRHEIEHFFKLLGFKPDYVAESQDMMVQKLMATKGTGVIAAPKFAVKEYLSEKSLFLIGELEGVYEELYLVAASRKIENPIAIDLMRSFKID